MLERFLIISDNGSSTLADIIKIIPRLSLIPNGSLANRAAVIDPKIISVIISKPTRPGLTYFGPHNDAKAPGITKTAIKAKSQGRTPNIFSNDGSWLEAKKEQKIREAIMLQKKNPIVISVYFTMRI